MMPEYYLALAALLFCIGLVGAVSRRNLFVIYMSIELMLNAINLMLATFARAQNDHGGTVMALLLIAVIASEAAVFLSMIITLFRTNRTIDADFFTNLSQEQNP
jgi:NADH-quinone oxidoreductase subunit K